MRVMITADAAGGVWTYAIELARALQGSVTFLLVVTGPEPSRDQAREAAGIDGLEIRYRPYALEWMENPWRDVDRTTSWLRELEAEFRPDVVHLNGYSSASARFEAPILVVAHSCVVTWWRAVHRADPPVEWDRYRRRVERGLQSATEVVAPTHSMLDALRDAYVFDTPASVIHNGIDRSGERASVKRANVVLGAGRLWDEAKNAATLADAASLVEWPVQLAGEGDAGACGNVIPLGRLPHDAMLAAMRGAAIYVHPALYEPFGLAPLEAASEGCALVLSDIPSLREIWGDAARFVNGRDARSIGKALNALIASPTELRALSRKAKSRASRFSAGRMADAYLQKYRRLSGQAVASAESYDITKEMDRHHEHRGLLPLTDL